MNEEIPLEYGRPQPYVWPLEEEDKIPLPCPPIASPISGEPIKYRNINTGEVLHIVKTEVLNNPHRRVIELSDGSRWDETLFSRYWKIVSSD